MRENTLGMIMFTYLPNNLHTASYNCHTTQLPIHPPIQLPIYPSIYTPTFHPCIYLFTLPLTHQPIPLHTYFPPMHLPIYPSYPPTHLSCFPPPTYPSTHLLSTHASTYLPFHSPTKLSPYTPIFLPAHQAIHPSTKPLHQSKIVYYMNQ